MGRIWHIIERAAEALFLTLLLLTAFPVIALLLPELLR